MSCGTKLVNLCENDEISHNLTCIIIIVKVETFYVILNITAESIYITDQLYALLIIRSKYWKCLWKLIKDPRQTKNILVENLMGNDGI